MKIVCFTLEAEGTMRPSGTGVTVEPTSWGEGVCALAPGPRPYSPSWSC